MATKRRRMRSRRFVASLALVAIVAGLAGGGFGYLQLKASADRLQATITVQLQAGQQELEAGKSSLTEASKKHDLNLITQGVAHFDAARVQFLAAGQTADNSQLLHDLELIPAAGSLAYSRHVAVTGISQMGVALADAGKDASDLERQLITPPPAGTVSRNVLTILDEVQPTLAKVHADLGRAQKASADVDMSVLPGGQQGTFANARNSIRSSLSGLVEISRLVHTLQMALRGNAARTYLIEQV